MLVPGPDRPTSATGTGRDETHATRTPPDDQPADGPALVGGAAVLGFGCLYLTGLAVAGDAIADGTHVRGVDIGGMSRTEAKAALDHALGPAAAAPIEVRIGERAERAAPAAFGLSLDTAATADRAAQSGSDPVTVIGRLLTPAEDREVEPVIRTDGPTNTAEVDRLNAAGHEARDGAITFEDGTARATAPVTGVAVRAGQTADTVRAAYLRPQGGTVALPVDQKAPVVGQQETTRALKEFAEPAMSGPITLTVAGKPVTLTPAVLGRYLTAEPDAHGRLVPKLDAEGLLADPAVARQVAAATSPSRGPPSASTPPAGRSSPRTDARGRRSPRRPSPTRWSRC